MNKKYINDFIEYNKTYQVELAEKMVVAIKSQCINKFVGIYISPDYHWNGLYRQEMLKIFILKDVLLEFTDLPYPNYIFVDDKGLRYRVTRPFLFYNISLLLNDFNKNQPEVSFKYFHWIETEVNDRSEFKRFLRRILKFFKIKMKTKTYRQRSSKFVSTKVKNISILKGDIEDQLIITDFDGNNYELVNPDVSIIKRSPIDPFGEEEWDD